MTTDSFMLESFPSVEHSGTLNPGIRAPYNAVTFVSRVEGLSTSVISSQKSYMIGEFCPKVFALNIKRTFGLNKFGRGAFYPWCRSIGVGRQRFRRVAFIHSKRGRPDLVSKWNCFPLLSVT